MGQATAIARSSKALTAKDLAPETLTLDELVAKSSPLWEPKAGHEELEYFAAWLAHFVLQCKATPETLRGDLDLAAQLDVGGARKRILPEIYRTA